jgi:hypothetical protein
MRTFADSAVLVKCEMYQCEMYRPPSLFDGVAVTGVGYEKTE